MPEDKNKKIEIMLSLIDSSLNKPINAKAAIYSKDSSEMYKFTIDNTYKDKIKFDTDKNYFLYVEADNYLPYYRKIIIGNKERWDKMNIDVSLTPVKKGAKIILENIYFETGETELLNASHDLLNKIDNYLKKHTSVKVEISGHTDNIGNLEYNKTLSKKRANAVKEYLVNKGISKFRLQSKGYAYKYPIADNDTYSGRAKNRRVEFKVVSY